MTDKDRYSLDQIRLRSFSFHLTRFLLFAILQCTGLIVCPAQVKDQSHKTFPSLSNTNITCQILQQLDQLQCSAHNEMVRALNQHCNTIVALNRSWHSKCNDLETPQSVAPLPKTLIAVFNNPLRQDIRCIV